MLPMLSRTMICYDVFNKNYTFEIEENFRNEMCNSFWTNVVFTENKLQKMTMNKEFFKQIPKTKS